MKTGWRNIALSLVAACAGPMAQAWAGGELVLRSEVVRTDVPADALVQLASPYASVDVPPGSSLEYDIFLSPENVSYGGGVCVVTRKGSVIKEPTIKDDHGTDTHFVRSAVGLERLAKGRWYHRKISLDTLSGAPATEIFVAASAGDPRATGHNEVRYRDIHLTDGNGREVADLMPKLGTLPYPLIQSSPYVQGVRLEAPLVSGGFEAGRYLTASDEPFSGTIRLKNFDPASPAQVSYVLTLDRLDGTGSSPPPVKGETRLPPGEELAVPVSLPPLARGHYRPHLHLKAGGEESTVQGYAVTALPKAAIAARRAPFSKDGFGMGAVSISGGTPVQTLPLVRELGANYFHLRIDWAQLEPKRGQYDVSCVEPFVEMARRCGMWLQLDLYSGYPSYTVPRWDQADEMISSTGKTNRSDYNCAVAYWTPARQEGLQVLRALLARYGSAGEVVAWNAWIGGNMDSFYLIRGTPQDAGLQDYSPSSQEKFREYLRTVSGLSLEDAAKRYGLKLDSWQDLRQPPPRLDGVDLSPLWHDFFAYRSWSVEAVEKEASNIVAGLAPKASVEYLYGGSLGSLGRNGNDFDAALRNARASGGSVHHTASPGAENQVYLGTARRRFGVGFSIETAGTPASPADHQHAIFELLSQNASAYTYIQSGVWGLTPVPKAEYGFGEFRPALERLAGAGPAGASAAIVFPYSDMAVDPFSTALPGTQAATAFIRRMETVGYDVDVYTDRTTGVRWSDYPVVVSAFSSALAPEFTGEMVRYVENGGKLIVLAGTGEFTPGETGERFQLLKSLGCHPASVSQTTPPGRSKANFHVDGLTAAGVELSNVRPMPGLPDGATIWARDDTGAPAAASWPMGRGAVMMWSGWPGVDKPWHGSPVAYGRSGSSATSATVFPTVLDAALERFAGLRLPMACATPDVLFSLRKKKEDYFVILFNNSPHPVTATLRLPLPAGKYDTANLTRPSAHEWVTAGEESTELSVGLTPLEVTVIQLSPGTVEPPALDFPSRTRFVPPPETAWSGNALREMFQPAAEAVAPVMTGTPASVKVADGAVIKVTFPAPGQYRLVFKTPPGGQGPMLQNAAGEALAAEKSVSSLGVEYAVPLEASGETGAFLLRQGMTLDWADLRPIFSPPPWVMVSPGRDNPGPFPGNGFNADDGTEVALLQTGNVPPDAGWKKVVPPSGGKIDLAATTGKSHGLADVAWSVETRAPRKILLGLGADYGLKLWLNSVLIFDSTKTRREGPARANEFVLPVQLQEGTNHFLAKVAAGTAGWSVDLSADGW